MVPILLSVGATKSEAYAAMHISSTIANAISTFFFIPMPSLIPKPRSPHSSRRYSPKSHSAVKKTTSNARRKPSQSQRIVGFGTSSAAVASVLAISTGVSSGKSRSGSSSSRILACAEIADKAVPVTESPRLPMNMTSTNCGNAASTGTLYRIENTGRSKTCVNRRNRVFAASLARKIAKGSFTESRSALSVAFVCSRKKQGCNISEAAKRNASQSNPGPKRRDSLTDGSNVKLKSTTMVRIKTTVVVSSSRERNSVRSSLPSSTAVLESSAIHAFAKARIERKFAPVRVSATTPPASSRIARVARVETSDSPCRLIKMVRPESLKPRKVCANQLTPCGSSPVTGSSNRITAGSFSSARGRLCDSLQPCKQHQVLFRRQFVINHRGVSHKTGWRLCAADLPAAIEEAHSARRRTRQPRRNSQQSSLAGAIPSCQRNAFSRGDFQRYATQRVKPAIPFVDFFEADSCGRKTRSCHRTASEVSTSLPVFKTQPRTRSRNTFSARARSCAYSSSEMVPACRRSSSRKSRSFRASRLVPIAESRSARLDAPFVGVLAGALSNAGGADGLVFFGFAVTSS